MKSIWIITVVITALVVSSCTPAFDEIEYGKDACHYCSMTIVDKQYASEFVTNKGRTYKFDSIECMINEIDRREKDDIHKAWVSDYMNPGAFIEAVNAYFLVSPHIPSPMSGGLAAFDGEENMRTIQNEKEGAAYDWNALKKHMH